jgi:Rhodopirellula transposase DDE domain
MGEAERGQRRLRGGRASKPRALLVEALAAGGHTVEAQEQPDPTSIPIHRDTGPESRGRRPPWLRRRGPGVDASGPPVQGRYFPSDHSQYQPLERCWRRVERHGKGTPLVDAATR